MARSETPEAELPPRRIPPALRIASTVLRAIFIFTLVAIAVRVSLPQSETIWTAYETPTDLIRFFSVSGSVSGCAASYSRAPATPMAIAHGFISGSSPYPLR